MKLIGIVAISENSCIGYKNKLPWSIPRDLQHFRSLTMGYPVIMGRKTYQSLPNRLEGRREIILSKDWYRKRLFIDGLEVYSSIDGAINQLKKENKDTAFIIGGSKVYKSTIRMMSELYITKVHTTVNGDTYFPKVSKNFSLISEVHYDVSDLNMYPITFLHYKRK